MEFINNLCSISLDETLQKFSKDEQYELYNLLYYNEEIVKKIVNFTPILKLILKQLEYMNFDNEITNSIYQRLFYFSIVHDSITSFKFLYEKFKFEISKDYLKETISNGSYYVPVEIFKLKIIPIEKEYYFYSIEHSNESLFSWLMKNFKNNSSETINEIFHYGILQKKEIFVIYLIRNSLKFNINIFYKNSFKIALESQNNAIIEEYLKSEQTFHSLSDELFCDLFKLCFTNDKFTWNVFNFLYRTVVLNHSNTKKDLFTRHVNFETYKKCNRYLFNLLDLILLNDSNSEYNHTILNRIVEYNSNPEKYLYNSEYEIKPLQTSDLFQKRECLFEIFNEKYTELFLQKNFFKYIDCIIKYFSYSSQLQLLKDVYFRKIVENNLMRESNYIIEIYLKLNRESMIDFINILLSVLYNFEKDHFEICIQLLKHCILVPSYTSFLIDYLIRMIHHVKDILHRYLNNLDLNINSVIIENFKNSQKDLKTFIEKLRHLIESLKYIITYDYVLSLEKINYITIERLIEIHPQFDLCNYKIFVNNLIRK